jgi:hypothetical protein
MNGVIETITPAKAQEYLRTSQGNRPLSKVFIGSFADTMKKGGWKQNGIPIVFDINGHLLDGHHRLEAVIKANIPVTFYVVRGVGEDCFTTYDNGRHRNLGQILAMRGVKHYNLVGSMVVANERLIKSGRLYDNNLAPDVEDGVRKRRTNDENYFAYRQDAEGFDRVAEYVVALQSRCRIMAASWVGGTYYYLTHTGGYTDAEVAPFFEALHTLDSEKVPAASLLRKVIT